MKSLLISIIQLLNKKKNNPRPARKNITQQTHFLDTSIGQWRKVSDNKIETPFWATEKRSLSRFQNN